MKLSKKDMDIILLILQTNESLSTRQVKQFLKITQKQLIYSLTKINKYIDEHSNEHLYIEKGKFKITNKQIVQNIFSKFRAVTTPQHYRYCSKVIKNYIILKLLISDEYVPIEYFKNNLFVSRTTITKAINQAINFLTEEGITYERILRRGYKITTNSYHRFYLFTQVLRDTISVREIYLFFYNQQEIYSKQAELIFFTIFDCDKLLQNIKRVIAFSKNLSDNSVDDNRFLIMLILNYKLTITPKTDPLVSTLRQYIKRIEEAKHLVDNEEVKVQQLICWINDYLSVDLGWGNTYSENFWKNIKYPILKFIYRVENKTDVKYLDIDNKFIIKKYPELFKSIKTAITTFQKGIYNSASNEEIVLITAHYITELNRNIPKINITPKILIVSEGDKTFASLLTQDINKYFQNSIVENISNFEFLEIYLKQYDLILTTVPLVNIKSPKVIKVHYPLTPNIIEAISKKINLLNSKTLLDGLYKFPRLMITIKESYNTMVNPEVLEMSILRILCNNEIVVQKKSSSSIIFDENSIDFYNNNFFWEEAIKLSTQNLVVKQIAKKCYYKSIIDKIKSFGLYMQIFPGILIIHTFDSSQNYGLSVSVFQNGVMFPGINKINIIIHLFSDDHKGYIILEKLARWFSKIHNISSITSYERKVLYKAIKSNILNDIE